MTAILLGHDAAVADYVGRLLGKPFSAELPYSAIGVISPDGRLTGGYVFTGYNGTMVELSLAGAGVAARSAWCAVLAYVFDQLGCARLQVHTRRDNVKARKQATRLGLRYEGTMRAFYGDCPALVFSLVSEDLPEFRRRWRLG